MCDERTVAWLCDRLAGLAPDQLEAIGGALRQIRSILGPETSK